MQSTTNNTIGSKVSRINLIKALLAMRKDRVNSRTRLAQQKNCWVGSEFMHHFRVVLPVADWQAKQEWQAKFDQHCASLPVDFVPTETPYKG
jgi:arginine/ornithine N-succinyltransferase beta subunit